MNEQLGPIPGEFYSFDTGRPFKHCLICGVDLTTDNQDYFVEKAIRNYSEHHVQDVVYEYAMCLDCAQKMHAKMSVESQRNIHKYFSSQEQFMNAIQNHTSSSLDVNLKECLITHQTTEQMSEYVLYGHFRGNHMVLTTMPYVLNCCIMEEVSELLSAKTIGEIDDFSGKYFGGPPELEELFRTRKPVFF